MLPVIYNYAAATTTGIATSQAGTSGVALTFNPATYDRTNIATSQVIADNRQSQRSVALASTANLSSVLFTVAGYDPAGTLVTQTITGPNNSTVYTTTGYTVVSSITPNATFIAASGVTAGFGTSGVTHWHIPSNWGAYFGIGGGVVVSGSLTYTLQHTFDDIFNTSLASLNVFSCDDTALVGATTSQSFNYAYPIGASRVAITGTGTGSLEVVWRQPGV